MNGIIFLLVIIMCIQFVVIGVLGTLLYVYTRAGRRKASAGGSAAKEAAPGPVSTTAGVPQTSSPGPGVHTPEGGSGDIPRAGAAFMRPGDVTRQQGSVYRPLGQPNTTGASPWIPRPNLQKTTPPSGQSEIHEGKDLAAGEAALPPGRTPSASGDRMTLGPTPSDPVPLPPDEDLVEADIQMVVETGDSQKATAVDPNHFLVKSPGEAQNLDIVIRPKIRE